MILKIILYITCAKKGIKLNFIKNLNLFFHAIFLPCVDGLIDTDITFLAIVVERIGLDDFYSTVKIDVSHFQVEL